MQPANMLKYIDIYYENLTPEGIECNVLKEHCILSDSVFSSMRRNMEKGKIAVAIPVYTSKWSPNENKSFRKCMSVLSDYDIFIVTHEDIDLHEILTAYPKIKTVFFDKDYFSSIKAYNRLVLSEDFYAAFDRYEYMLIYQLDAFVFKDELKEWCEQGYDYIGAPWIPYGKYLGKWGKFYLNLRFHLFFLHKTIRHHKFFMYQVGNGGFSLRKISKFRYITHKYKDKFSALTSDTAPFYPEDTLLLYELQGTSDALKKPSFDTALHFAFEENPKWAYKRIGNRLPFGCHAWYHPAYARFWKSFVN